MMKKTLLLALAAAGCRGYSERDPAALVVRTEPPGATVRVGKLDLGWMTPCEISHRSIRRGQVEVTLSLEGHESQVHQVYYDGRTASALDARLSPRVATGDRVRVTAGGRVVAEVPAKGGEVVRVELLDAATGEVRRVVDVAPVAEAPAEGRVGRVQLVHRVFGVFVKLEEGLKVAPGEEIVIYREGREVTRTKILQVTSADGRYPDGAAQVSPEGAGIQKGDEVRRPK